MTETTYLLRTRPGTQSSVTTTLEKYYGNLVDEMVVRTTDTCGLVYFETTHELPLDAFRRIVDVEDAFEGPISIDDPSQRAIETGIAYLVSQLSDGERVAIEVVASDGDHPDATEVERQVEDSLGSKDAVRAGPDEPTHRLHITLADDWASLAAEPVP